MNILKQHSESTLTTLVTTDGIYIFLTLSRTNVVFSVSEATELLFVVSKGGTLWW